MILFLILFDHIKMNKNVIVNNFYNDRFMILFLILFDQKEKC